MNKNADQTRDSSHISGRLYSWLGSIATSLGMVSIPCSAYIKFYHVRYQRVPMEPFAFNRLGPFSNGGTGNPIFQRHAGMTPLEFPLDFDRTIDPNGILGQYGKW